MRLGVFLSLLLFVPIWANQASAQECGNWILKLGEVAQAGSGLLFLEPGEQRFLIASLVRVRVKGDKKPKRLLAVTGYADQHSGIHAALQKTFKSAEIESYRYEWMGETRWLNAHEYAAQGSLVEANETAGFFPRTVEPEALGQNRIGKLIASLRAHDRAMRDRDCKRVRCLSPTRLRIPYERSMVTQGFHLMPGLDEFIAPYWRRRLDFVEHTREVPG